MPESGRKLGEQTLLRSCAARSGLRLLFDRRERAHQAQRFGVMSEDLEKLGALGAVPANRGQAVHRRVITRVSRTLAAPSYRAEF
jgi:hypothetical protein